MAADLVKKVIAEMAMKPFLDGQTISNVIDYRISDTGTGLEMILFVNVNPAYADKQMIQPARNYRRNFRIKVSEMY